MDHLGIHEGPFTPWLTLSTKMELTIEIPDGFAPTKVDYELPNGLTKEQVENPPQMTRFGKVNCQHSNVVVLERLTARARTTSLPCPIVRG